MGLRDRCSSRSWASTMAAWHTHPRPRFRTAPPGPPPGKSKPPEMPPLDLTITATTGRGFVPLLRRQLPRVHRMLKSPLRELSIALVGNQRMAGLHKQFMSIDSPTDVLTF